jgi:uncharacterized protein (TIGR03086 family)
MLSSIDQIRPAEGATALSTSREQYLNAWDQLVTLAETVPATSWKAPTPCADWSARQLAGHTVDAARQTQALLQGHPPLTPVTAPAALNDLVGDDPAAAIRAAARSLTAIVSEPDPAAAIATPHGAIPVEQFLAMALVEPVIHAWDLAVATERPLNLDDDAVATLLLGVDQLGDQLAATGMYAAALPAPAAASPAERLLAALGRRS